MINNPEKFLASIWDWSFLDNCFGNTKIKVSDIDGVVERNGQFLFIETKGHGVTIPHGQNILHKALIAMGNATLFIIWGDPNETASQVEIHCRGGEIIVRRDVTTSQLQDFISKWFDFANAIPRPQFA
jgi:hypothetical protein